MLTNSLDPISFDSFMKDLKSILQAPGYFLSLLVERASLRVLFQEFVHLRKKFWGGHSWTGRYLAVISGTITGELIEAYIADQEGEPLQDDSVHLNGKNLL
jgi:putative transposase